MMATTRRALVLGTSSLLGPLATFGGRGARAASDAAEIDRDATRAFQQLLKARIAGRPRLRRCGRAR